VISGKSMDDLLVEMIELPRPPLVPGLPGASGVPVDAARRASALRRLRHAPPGAPAQGRQPREVAGMKLLRIRGRPRSPFFLIAGPCVVESEQLQIDTAGTLKEITGALGIPFIFKSSFDKANRTSGKSFRGPGMDEGLRFLSEVKRQLGVPVLTDVHEYTPWTKSRRWSTCCRRRPSCVARPISSRRWRAGKPVNIKKGQFLAPGT
jgi:3-deoxy-D-manno-octulosonic acid (KDO) 8-phosphate synthase